MQTNLFPKSDDVALLRKRLLRSNQILCRAYDIGPELYEEEILDPLSDLIHALLGHRTRYEVNDRAHKALLKRYGDDGRTWERVRDAREAELVKLIRGVTFPEQKARTLKKVLERITELRNGDLSLDFLKSMSVREAREWLEDLPGVGPKTSAIVLLYSTLKMPALVIDTHHYRVTSRLGLFPPGVTIEKAEAYLQKLIPLKWGAREYADHHLALFIHGQECCYFQKPKCATCPVLELCPFGQSRIS